MSDVIYEPRSLWSMTSTATETDAGAEVGFSVGGTIVQFPRTHFKNPSRYPITLTRFAYAAINYTFQELSIDGDARGVWNSMSIQQLVSFRISSPFRQMYLGWLNPFFIAPGIPQTPRGEPETPLFISGLFNNCYLEFDKPLVSPKLGTYEFQPSNYTAPLMPGAPVRDSRVSMLWHEVGGPFMGGAGRQKQNVLQSACNPQPLPYDAENAIPFPIDNIGANSALPTAAANQPWVPNALFSARDFSRQTMGRQGSNCFRGLSTHIDQQEMDTSYQIPPFSNFPVTPLSARMGCRARSVDGGSGENWWMPGAPICLVLDTLTPANVYVFPHPIVLEPGDTLDVSMHVPTHDAVGSPPTQPRMTVGISFNGYATIEG